jgi:hypothetical protein
MELKSLQLSQPFPYVIIETEIRQVQLMGGSRYLIH